MFGQSVAYVEVFCGAMELTIGVRAIGLYAGGTGVHGGQRTFRAYVPLGIA